MLIVVGVVVVLCCGGLVAGGVALSRTVQSTVGPARDTVDTFLTHLEAGQTSAAYDELCTPTRTQFTLDAFTRIVTGRPKPIRHSISGANVANVNGHVSALVNATLNFGDGSSDNHQFELAKEGNVWRVCGQPY